MPGLKLIHVSKMGYNMNMQAHAFQFKKTVLYETSNNISGDGQLLASYVANHWLVRQASILPW